MKAKDEFYDLISLSFSESEVSTIKVIVDALEIQLCELFPTDDNKRNTEIRALYYDCCALFYSSAKDFDNFKINLTNKQLPVDYTKYVLSSQDKIGDRKRRNYDDIHCIVLKFIQNSTDWGQLELDVKSLALAITNAIIPEISVQEDIKELLCFYKDIKEIQKLSFQINDGKKITRIAFDLNAVKSVCVISNSLCTSNFYNDLVKFSSYRVHLPDNIDEEIEKLESQVKRSVNRIVYRICMVLVHYNILKKITASDKYILKNANQQSISLEQGIMYKVSLLLEGLGQKLKERANEYGSIGNTKYAAEKIKNLMRTGKEGLGDTFDFCDITDMYWGCFISKKKSSNSVE